MPLANRHVNVIAKQAIQELDSAFNSVHSELSYLTDQKIASQSCDELSSLLKKEVFKSDLAKEIGLFRPSGEVFCTNNASDEPFYLYQTIMSRLKHNGTTLSYTKSKVSQVRSVFLLFSGESGYGVTALIPPRYIFRIPEDISEFGLEYRLDVISRDISGAPPSSERKATASYKSDKYPLKVSVYTSQDYYLHYFVMNSWMGLLIAAIVTFYYFYARNKLISGNSLESALQNALINEELDVHYQPIIDSRDSKIVGFESLVRWKDPDEGYISPGIFIPLAEKLNLIDQITEQVMSKVITFIAEHGDAINERYVSINISRSLILKPEFVEWFTKLYRERPDLTNKIVFEITEDINFSNQELDLLKAHLRQISEIGIRVAIDDFGTGYSGLDFIRQYPFDIIKIDRVFVNNLSEDSTIIPLLESMKMISNTLNMKVIVEGVEEKTQVDLLSSLGFCFIQGFYYHRPMPKEDLLALINAEVN
ncbi:EAL domain-containing protein [Vibrio hannami]|uniref:EAL domain-containing protein n=1 Tax=Vibrio hannami TaxID=2717094 RepID=UPI00240F4AC1|nr:EAL domain-containing protein [Vibrio hannami]MDG3085782.1 EAL domain-containing protein [Vibrio hannami]